MNAAGKEIKGPEVKADKLIIRTSNFGHLAYFEYSTDVKSYRRFGPNFTAKFGKWTGDRLGFFCWNEKGESGYVDVNWFAYKYDRPKGEKNYETFPCQIGETVVDMS